MKRPKKAFDKVRIEEENEISKKFGLKNKKEIWKAESKIAILRRRAKDLITADTEKQEEFLSKLKKDGFDVKNIADVLGLNKEDWLKRRLQTMLMKKNLVKNPKEARQLIVHKHVKINGNVVNIPSYMIKKDEEDKITLSLIRKTKEMEKREIKKVPNENVEKEKIEEVGDEKVEDLVKENEVEKKPNEEVKEDIKNG